MKITRMTDEDWPDVWAIMEPNIRAGETYPYAMDMPEREAHRMWREVTEAAYVARDDDGNATGTYYIKPNQPTLGAHVANCGYLVADSARPQGVGSAIGEPASDVGRYRLWQKMGYETVGTLPGAFKHPKHGYVDAYVMFKTLVDTD